MGKLSRADSGVIIDFHWEDQKRNSRYYGDDGRLYGWCQQRHGGDWDWAAVDFNENEFDGGTEENVHKAKLAVEDAWEKRYTADYPELSDEVNKGRYFDEPDDDLGLSPDYVMDQEDVDMERHYRNSDRGEESRNNREYIYHLTEEMNIPEEDWGYLDAAIDEVLGYEPGWDIGETDEQIKMAIREEIANMKFEDGFWTKDVPSDGGYRDDDGNVVKGISLEWLRRGDNSETTRIINPKTGAVNLFVRPSKYEKNKWEAGWSHGLLTNDKFDSPDDAKRFVEKYGNDVFLRSISIEIAKGLLEKKGVDVTGYSDKGVWGEIKRMAKGESGDGFGDSDDYITNHEDMAHGDFEEPIEDRWDEMSEEEREEVLYDVGMATRRIEEAVGLKWNEMSDKMQNLIKQYDEN